MSPNLTSLNSPARIAVIGAGVSGLGAAWALRNVHDVTVFEKRDRLGGHANTVRIDYDGAEIDVDTGFIVFNPLNYPNLIALFAHLGIESFQTDMSSASAWIADLNGLPMGCPVSLRTPPTFSICAIWACCAIS